MRTVEAGATYRAEPEKVWEVLANPSRYAEWLSIHRSWRTEPPVRVAEADTATANLRVMNMPITVDWTFAKVDAPHVIEMRGTTRAKVGLTLTITLADVGTATAVAVVVAIDGGMIDGPMGGIFKNSLAGALDKSLGSVARLLD
jgi:uncharacterized protein YndB with AHSA1/START domain